MEFARSTWRLFAANARTAILFEFGFRFLFAILFVPACFGMVDLAMEAAGLAYLADTNMTTLFANPLAWVFLLVATLVLALGALFEMCALVVVMQAGKTGRRIGVFETSRLAFSSARRIARPSNWLLALFVLLLVPLTNLTVTSSALTGVRLPEFIMDFIWENGALTAVFVIVMAALYLHAFFWRSAFTSSRCATNPGCRHASRAGACCAATPGGWRAVCWPCSPCSRRERSRP